MSKEIGFMELVEIHERRWGTQQYKGRPTLKQLLEYPFVAVWACKANFTLSVYLTLEGMSRMVTGMITGAVPNPDNRKLVRIYHKQQPYSFSLQIVESAPPPAKVPAGPQADSQPMSDVSRGARYRPGVVGRFGYRPDVADVNSQRAPRFIRFDERAHQPGDYLRYGQAAKAREHILPGRKREIIRRFDPRAKTTKSKKTRP